MVVLSKSYPKGITMAKSSKSEVAKKRAERIAAREKISNTLLLEFVYCIVASLCLMTHILLWNRGGIVFLFDVLLIYALPCCILVAVVLALLPKLTKGKIKYEKVRPWVYFFVFLGIIYLIFFIWTKATFLANVSWLGKLKFGNMRYGSMPAGFSAIWLGFVIFIIKAIIKSKRVGK